MKTVCMVRTKYHYT